MDPNLHGVSKKPQEHWPNRTEWILLPRHPQNLGRETAGYLSWRAEWGSANAIELEDEVEGIGSLGGGRIREGREGGQAG